MVNSDTLRTAIGIAGNIVSFGLFLSPVPTYNKIRKRKDVEDYSPNPYLATVMNCAMWVFYGTIHPHSFLVLTINSIGLVMEAIFIAIYLIYANSAKKRAYVLKVLAGELFAITVIVVCVSLFDHSEGRKSMIVGIICVFFNICMYGMPLDNCMTVVRTKSVEFMPVWMSFFQLLCAGTWLGYGFLIGDWHVAVPNVIGLLFAAIQIGLYIKYRDEKSKAGDVPMVELSEIGIGPSKGDLEMQQGLKLPGDGVLIGVVPETKLPVLIINVDNVELLENTTKK